MSLLLVLGSFLNADVNRLDADAYETREDAHARLRFAGLVAVPALLRGTESESPEVRKRCGDLLGRYRRLTWNLKAVAVLTAPDLPDQMGFWEDGKLRTHVFAIARDMGCNYHVFDMFGPGLDPEPDVSQFTPFELECVLQAFRAQLGYETKPRPKP